MELAVKQVLVKKQKPEKTKVDLFREKAFLMRDANQNISLYIGHNEDIEINLKNPKKDVSEGFINKYHRKRIYNFFKLSKESDFVLWIQSNLTKHLK